MKLSKIVREVAALADKINVELDTELPKRHPQYPFVESDDEWRLSPQERKLQTCLAKLPPDVIYKLTFLMHLGRGDFGAVDIRARLAEIKNRFPKPEMAASQMAGKASLGEYLEEGVQILRGQGMDVDDLAAAPHVPEWEPGRR